MSAASFRPLAEADAALDFQTRQPDLSEFFRDDAWKNEQAGYGRTFVIAGGNDEPPVLGYYTLAMNRLGKDDFPQGEQKGLLYSVQPVAVLTNVARDQRVPKERKLGELLVGHALRRVLDIADHIGCLGVALFAMNQGLQDYYAGLGFVRLERKPSKNNPSQLMFLALSTLRANA